MMEKPIIIPHIQTHVQDASLALGIRGDHTFIMELGSE